MLKTSIDSTAKPSMLLFMLASLKGYVRFPLIYMVKIIAGINPIMKKIPDTYPEDLKKICALMISMYSVFRQKLDSKKALSLVKAVSIPMGLSVQMANFRYVEAERTLKNLIKYQKRTNMEGPTRKNEMKVITENESSYIFQIENECCFFKLFSIFNMPVLTTVFCEIDNAIFNIYLPDRLLFHRNGINNRIADGAPICSFHCNVISAE